MKFAIFLQILTKKTNTNNIDTLILRSIQITNQIVDKWLTLNGFCGDREFNPYTVGLPKKAKI